MPAASLIIPSQFLSHDGITNLAELMDAQQNLYNLDYPLALIIALRAIALDGDIVTTRLSIGCDATARTSVDPAGVLGRQPGLDGHNRFEGDTSLTRDDFFFYGDDFTFNGTLFQSMYEHAQEFGGGLFNRDAIAAYRAKRYDDSLATNPNFYFGPKALLLYGAASFIYNAFPGSTAQPDLENTATFFGAVDNGDGTWSKRPERIPQGWRNRETPYTVTEIGNEVFAQYTASPKLFGGNVGANNFLALNTTFGLITDGEIPDDATAADFTCFLYQLLTENVPGQVENEPELGTDALEWLLTRISPVFEDLGCPLDPNPDRKGR